VRGREREKDEAVLFDYEEDDVFFLCYEVGVDC
jgi:hypothetical protein